MRSRSPVFALALTCLVAACAAEDAPILSDDSTADDVELAAPVAKADRAQVAPAASKTSTFYSVTRDLRKCAWPLCGGYLVSRVNFPTTRCNDGVTRASCYVVDMDLENGLGLAADEAAQLRADTGAHRVILRGDLKTADYDTRKLGFFVPTEGWRSASTKAATGVIYKVVDKGIRCLAAPCMTYEEAKLNSTTIRDISQVELGGVGLSDAAVNDAFTLLAGADGLLVAGANQTYAVSARPGTLLAASQLWTRVRHAGGLAAYTPAARELMGRGFADARPAAPTYPRTYAFAADGGLSVQDAVAPCPPGVTCVWSGIVTRQAVYTVSGDQLHVTYDRAAAPGGYPSIRYFSTLLVRQDPAGKLVLLEQGDDGSQSGRQFR